MKKITNALSMSVLLSSMCFAANANMVTSGAVIESNDFTTLSTAWNPGADTARTDAGNAAAGGATWSIMGAGLADVSGIDSHTTNTTSMLDLPGLAGSGVTMADIATVMNKAIDLWTVSGFSNLGQVADSGAGIGAGDGAGGNVADIRIGAIFIDGGTGSNTLAHAYQPGNDNLFGAGGNVAGDVHFDNSNSWFISAEAGLLGGQKGSGTIDLFTVAIHEIGHALGMGHSSQLGSIMEPVYAGVRSSLHADDLLGIQSIYGPAAVVPVPGALVLFLSGGLGMIGLVRRKRVVK